MYLSRLTRNRGYLLAYVHGFDLSVYLYARRNKTNELNNSKQKITVTTSTRKRKRRKRKNEPLRFENYRSVYIIHSPTVYPPW